MADRYVPTLCFDDRMDPFGACRVCMVGVEGAAGPLAACTTPCKDDMGVNTEDETSRRIAGATVELVMSELPEPPRSTPSSRTWRVTSGSASRAGRASSAGRTTTAAIPIS